MSTVKILGKYQKQPGETLDYDIDFTPWFAKRSLNPDVLTVTAESGITVAASARTGAKVKVILSGGDDGTTYKVTVTLTSDSAPPLKKEVDFAVTVKAI